MEASARTVRVRRRQARRSRLVVRWTVLVTGLIALAAVLIGIAFAGSSDRLAAGIKIAGVDVGGLTPAQARRTLEQRAHRLAAMPVTAVAGSRRFELEPRRLGVNPDWAAAVAEARRDGDGVWPFRGLRRLGLRVFGDDVTPPASLWHRALRFRIQQIAAAVDRPHRDARLVRRGLHIVAVPGQDGRTLDTRAAEPLLAGALTSLSRKPVTLPVRTDPQAVTVDDLDDAAAQARTAVSAPVRLTLGPTRWRIPRWRIAKMLSLPKEGSRRLSIAGPGADAFFARMQRHVNRAPRNADFAVATHGIRIVPSRPGLTVDVRATADRLLAASLSRSARTAPVVVERKLPERSTAEARAMGIKGLVGSYETLYSGDANRIHNVRLVAQLIDRTLIAPGATFSFNATTGERNEAKGFREAPVIINGELQTGLGGGVCQVSTTVFNAAYEAGLGITERTNHALYISHYPLGRDATVNYPDTDLKFVNDTKHWLLLRTFVGTSSLTVGLYGTPVHRRVVSDVAPLVATGPVPVERVDDPALPSGERVVEETGVPPQRTSVHRRVYAPGHKLLHDDVWTSSYVAEPTVVKVGTKPLPKPEPKPPAKPEPKQPAQPKEPAGSDSGASTDKPKPDTTTTQP